MTEKLLPVTSSRPRRESPQRRPRPRASWCGASFSPRKVATHRDGRTKSPDPNGTDGYYMVIIWLMMVNDG